VADRRLVEPKPGQLAVQDMVTGRQAPRVATASR
jgi:hypothetical protein